jgi:hypothetical protein
MRASYRAIINAFTMIDAPADRCIVVDHDGAPIEFSVGDRRFIALDDDDERPSLLSRWRVYIIDDVDDCTMTESVDARARVSEPSAYNVASSLVQAACALLASATGASVELLATERPTTYLSA